MLKRQGLRPLVAISVLAVIGATPASASPVCEAIQKLVSLAPVGFATVRGEQDREGAGEGRDANAPPVYLTTLQPWRTACRIVLDTEPHGYSCHFSYKSELEARVGYLRLITDIRQCFPQAPEQPLTQAAFAHMKLLLGTSFRIVGGSASLEVDKRGGTGGWAVVFLIPRTEKVS